MSGLTEITASPFSERAVLFQSGGENLYGILHSPQECASTVAAVILVGGPQYRVGSHRQFVELARGLARQGIPSLRFDFTGMGDSTGVFPEFEHLDADVRNAVDALIEQRPEVQKVVLWGLCDGASAACFYAPKDERVVGLCLANPWVRTEQGEAKTFLKHYYVSRLCSRKFWSKVFSGKLQIIQALGGFMTNVKRSSQGHGERSHEVEQGSAGMQSSLPERVFGGLSAFPGKVMFLLSGNDLTAAEFQDSVTQDRKRQKLMNSQKVTMKHLPDADHTFSRRLWKEEITEHTANWIKSL